MVGHYQIWHNIFISFDVAEAQFLSILTLTKLVFFLSPSGYSVMGGTGGGFTHKWNYRNNQRILDKMLFIFNDFL